jgi:hypothetical protein
MSDNGRQFVSAEFESFCKSNVVRHTTSSVYHPRSNGEAGRFVQTFKRGMKSSEDSRLQRFLFANSITSHGTPGTVPCALLQRWMLRRSMDLSRLSAEDNVTKVQDRQRAIYDPKTKLRKFTSGHKVFLYKLTPRTSQSGLWELSSQHWVQSPIQLRSIEKP